MTVKPSPLWSDTVLVPTAVLSCKEVNKT